MKNHPKFGYEASQIYNKCRQFKNLFLICLLADVFAITHTLHNTLQGENLHYIHVLNLAASTIVELETFKGFYKDFFESIVKLANGLSIIAPEYEKDLPTETRGDKKRKRFNASDVIR